MFSLRGVGGVLSRLLPLGRGRRAPQPASPLEEERSRPPAGPLAPWYGKQRRGYSDKMLRPALYSDKGECR